VTRSNEGFNEGRARRRVRFRRRGGSLLEYGLLLGLIAALALIVVSTTGGKIGALFGTAGGSVDVALSGAGGTVGAPAAPLVLTGSLAGGRVGSFYSQTLSATAQNPVTWSVATGALPPGLTLAASTGVVSGTPTTAGTAPFTVQATDTSTGLSGTAALSISDSPGSPTISLSGVLPTAQTLSSYSGVLVASDPQAAPITWSVASGNLPPACRSTPRPGPWLEIQRRWGPTRRV